MRHLRDLLVTAALVAAPIAGVLGFGAVSAGAAVSSTGRAPAASTEAVTLNVPYSCDFPIIGLVPLVTTVTGIVPAAVTPGESFDLANVQASTTIPSYVVDWLVFVESSISGTVTAWDIDTSNGSPSVLNTVGTGISYGPVPLHFGHAAVITIPPSPASIGTFTAGSSGDVTLSAGALDFKSWFGSVQCSVAAHEEGAASVVIPIGGTPLPVGTTIGGFGIALVAGVGFVWRQRRRTLNSHLTAVSAEGSSGR